MADRAKSGIGGAMESTGVYWIAPHAVLEGGGMEVVLVAPGQTRNVPGRDEKTVPNDCNWIQHLHSCGLLTGHWREDHLFSLKQALKMSDAIEEQIAEYDREILSKLGEMAKPESRALYRMSGVGVETIQVVLSEHGRI